MDPNGAVLQEAIFPPSGTCTPEELSLWRKKVSDDISTIYKAIKAMRDELEGAKLNTATGSDSRIYSNQDFNTSNEIKRLFTENKQLKQELHEMKKKLISMESQSRRENLVFDGVAESVSETWVDTEQKIYELLSKMNVTDSKNIKFERVHRLGEKKPDKPRSIIVKFSHFKDRDLVWQKRFNLKKIDNKIWISEDFPQEIMTARKKLYPILREGLRLKKKSQSEIKNISLRSDKLLVNNKQFTVNDIDKLPECLQPERFAVKKDQNSNVVAFYSSNAIFSNLNSKFSFKIEGKTYNCPEQYFQSCKAIHFNDTETASKIVSTLDPHKQLQLGKSVRGYNHASWMKKARNVLLNANLAKYNQNDQARSLLLDTGEATLVESSPSTEWGSGVRLHEKDSTNPSAWKGKNVMGQILMEVRKNLRTPFSH